MSWAQGWETTFDAEAIQSYLQEDGLGFLVVAAGDGGEAVEKATASLETALQGDSVRLVMNDDVLGSVIGLDDAAIVAKVAGLPVDRVAIVRVFGTDSADMPDTAVVAVRDLQGKIVWAVSGALGEAIKAQDTPVAGGLGVSQDASKAVHEVVRASAQGSDAALEEYAERFLWFQDIIGINQDGGLTGQWSMIYRGKYKEPVEPEEFYNEIGRPDLAAEYKLNQTKKTAGWVLGTFGGLGLIGSITWVLGEGVTHDNPLTGEKHEPEYAVPVVLAVVSTGFFIGGIALAAGDVHPVPLNEARKLADNHNQKLKKELGISSDYTPILAPQTNSMKLRFGLSPRPGGVHGGIRLEF